MRECYEVLGLRRSASADEIKAAYRRLAHQYHPDKNPGDRLAEERFKEATQAYEILGDAHKRRRYDRFGPAAFGGADTGFHNVSDVFSGIFGDFFGKNRKPARHRGPDRTVSLKIGFVDAIFGATRTLRLPHHERCETCAGTGAEPGSTPQICQACRGKGEVRVQQGLFTVGKQCGYCQGKGRLVRQVCETCQGRGTFEVERDVPVSIPPGAENGSVVVIARAGEPSRNGGPPGDARVILEVSGHTVFRREGRDIVCEIPVGLDTVVLGGKVAVPTVHGEVTMKVPPGTQNGSVFRLRGKGVPNGRRGAAGDQRVTVRVEIPRDLGETQRAQLKDALDLGDRHYPDRASFYTQVKSSD